MNMLSWLAPNSARLTLVSVISAFFFFPYANATAYATPISYSGSATGEMIESTFESNGLEGASFTLICDTEFWSFEFLQIKPLMGASLFSNNGIVQYEEGVPDLNIVNADYSGGNNGFFSVSEVNYGSTNFLDSYAVDFMRFDPVTSQEQIMGGIRMGSSYFNCLEANPVPEPATMLLFGTGLAGLASATRKRSRKNRKN